MDSWASLPTDLLVMIFFSLEPTAVICCAGVCKPWRRAIIGNASILGPHLDRFGPSLLLGVFHRCKDAACLRRTPGPFQSALPSNDGGDNETAAAAHSFIPASSAISGGGVDRGLYRELLCSRDGFILLMARSGRGRSLCLCNPMTGDCTFLPSTARGRYSTYFLLTSSGDDLSPSGTGNKSVQARVLAVHTRRRYNDLESVFKFKAHVLSYQIFSTSGDDNAGGNWGPVRRSVGELEEGLCVWMHSWTTVVYGDAVYFLAGPAGCITCVLALDVRIGQTWTMELPKQCHFPINSPFLAILATSSDGRLCLMHASDWDQGMIQVWVLTTRDPGWTLQQTISFARESMISEGRIPQWFYLCAFCPRSRCMVGMSSVSEHEYLVDLGSASSCAPIVRIGSCDGFDCCPYEIDCSSTYSTSQE